LLPVTIKPPHNLRGLFTVCQDGIYLVYLSEVISSKLKYVKKAAY